MPDNGDDGVLIVRLGAVVTQMVLYRDVKLNRRERKCRMLGNGDDGVLLVRLGTAMTQTVLYITLLNLTGVRESTVC